MNTAKMVSTVRAALLRLFPGSRAVGDAIELATDGVRVTLRVLAFGPQVGALLVASDDGWMPPPLLAIETIELDGFSLRVVPKGREVARVPRDASTAEVMAMIPPRLEPDELTVVSEDPRFASVWLDVVTLGALARTLGVQVHPDRFAQVATITGCQADVGDGHIVIRPATLAPDHLAACARAGALLATRPQRLGREIGATLEHLGAIVTAVRFDLGRDFVGVVERGGATVRIDYVRRLPGEPPADAHLRTRIRAQRAGGAPTEPLQRRLRPMQALVVAARPGDLDENDGQVVLLWPGLIRAADRLVPAIELVARLAGGGASSGPYR